MFSYTLSRRFTRTVNTASFLVNNNSFTTACKTLCSLENNRKHFAETKNSKIRCSFSTLVNEKSATTPLTNGPVFGGVLPRNVLYGLKTSRHVVGPANIAGVEFRLFQYQTCPFCCKVRTFLDFYGLPYDVVEVNPVQRRQLKFSNYKKVPLLIVDKEDDENLLQLNDSSLIISILSSYLLFNNEMKYDLKILLNAYQASNSEKEIDRYFVMSDDVSVSKRKELEEERKWREWGDNVLVHTLSPNIYRSLRESINSFKYFSKVGDWERHFGNMERLMVIYAGASAMLFVGNKLKKKYSLKDNVRESLYDSCNYWLQAIGKDKPFFGGEKPSLADLTVYGLLSSIEGCQAFEDLVQNTEIKPWYVAVKKMCNNSAGYDQLPDRFKRRQF